MTKIKFEYESIIFWDKREGNLQFGLQIRTELKRDTYDIVLIFLASS
jgi:hypothetical protein